MRVKSCSLEVESLINTCCRLHTSSVEEFSVCTFKISLIQVTAHEFVINFGYLTSDNVQYFYLIQIVQILVHSHFDLVSSILILEATEPVSETVTQMVVELINNHLISVQLERLV